MGAIDFIERRKELKIKAFCFLVISGLLQIGLSIVGMFVCVKLKSYMGQYFLLLFFIGWTFVAFSLLIKPDSYDLNEGETEYSWAISR
jgi:hypothetical protein